MKHLLTICKILFVASLLVASVIGYRFFSVWQEDARPAVTEVSWENNKVTLGRQTVLHATVRIPWHRQLASPVPTHAPGSLVAVRRGGWFRLGPLDLSGHRTCRLAMPFVPSTVADVGGQPVELPLRATRRISPGTIAIPLPPLDVLTPEEIPDSLIVATDPLKPDTPVEQTASSPPPSKNPFPFGLVAGVLTLLVGAFFLIRHLRRPKPVVPPWVTARQALADLEQQSPPDSSLYFLRLTDILKHYTAIRFNMPTDAASSTELLASIENVSELGEEWRAPLARVVRQADSAKFAAAEIVGDLRRDALGEVRQFVETTTPDPEENHA